MRSSRILSPPAFGSDESPTEIWHEPSDVVRSPGLMDLCNHRDAIRFDYFQTSCKCSRIQKSVHNSRSNNMQLIILSNSYNHTYFFPDFFKPCCPELRGPLPFALSAISFCAFASEISSRLPLHLDELQWLTGFLLILES